MWDERDSPISGGSQAMPQGAKMPAPTQPQRADPAPVTVFDAIRQRRATREFLSKPVEEDTVRQLLDAAVLAPSARNLQPWSFVVIQDPALLKRISDEANLDLAHDPHWRHGLPAGPFDIFYGAGTLVVICSEEQGFCPIGDCYLAGENLMLAACGLGLASCPIGFARDVLRREDWRRELHVPAGETPVLPIAVGYPAGIMPRTERARPKIRTWISV